MPPRAMRRPAQYYAEPESEPEEDGAAAHVPAVVEDTSGDAAMARRIQLDLDRERDELRRQREEQRRQADNRRAAIRQVEHDEADQARDHFNMLQRMRAVAGGPGFGAPGGLARYGIEVEDADGMLLVDFGGLREAPRARFDHQHLQELRAHMMQDFNMIRARQEQSVQDSWAGINFVPRTNPLLGFTFDFDKDAEEAAEPTEIVRLDFDDDAPIIEELKSSGKSTAGQGAIAVNREGDGLTSLVCASCYMPLRVSQGQRNDSDRVFSLLCGHLVDKRCLDDISQPKPEQNLQAAENDKKPGFIKLGSSSTSRKDGNFVVHGDYGIVNATPVASTSPLPRIVSPTSPSSPTVPQVSSPPMVISSSIASGSNSRMPTRTTRSSTRVAAAPAVQHQANESPGSDDSVDTLDGFGLPPRSGRGRTRAGNPRKRKATTLAPKAGKATAAALKKLAKPEEKREYKWLCPVAACGREHYSEEIGGVWKPKEGMTVQLFV